MTKAVIKAMIPKIVFTLLLIIGNNFVIKDKGEKIIYIASHIIIKPIILNNQVKNLCSLANVFNDCDLLS